LMIDPSRTCAENGHSMVSIRLATGGRHATLSLTAVIGLCAPSCPPSASGRHRPMGTLDVGSGRAVDIVCADVLICRSNRAAITGGEVVDS